MGAPGDLASVCAVVDRARERIDRAQLPHLVMNDPGLGDYVAAYERVITGGVPALFEQDAEGLTLIASFDIAENLLLSHDQAGASLTHRWFSVMTAGIELLGAAVYRDVAFSRTLATLLVDSFALAQANVVGAPLDLMPPVCRELQVRAANPHERSLAVLGELFTAELTDAETDSLCDELGVLHERAQEWYGPDGEQNPFYAARSELVWGAAVRRSELPAWVELTRSHFPVRTERAREMRERLIREGEGWLSGRAGERCDRGSGHPDTGSSSPRRTR